ncbi:hypothetical protein Barb6XT_03207 [Bacteroidales bacterium Barb6XT]|nr:hypothetical protein Barb6XT_03207 [Bacteroidales bacterium Barb6XT]
MELTPAPTEKPNNYIQDVTIRDGKLNVHGSGSFSAPAPSNEDDVALRAQCLGLAIEIYNQTKASISDAGLTATADRLFGYLKNGKTDSAAYPDIEMIKEKLNDFMGRKVVYTTTGFEGYVTSVRYKPPKLI